MRIGKNYLNLCRETVVLMTIGMFARTLTSQRSNPR